MHSFVGDHNMIVTENTPCVSHITQRGPQRLSVTAALSMLLLIVRKLSDFFANNSEMVF